MMNSRSTISKKPVLRDPSPSDIRVLDALRHLDGMQEELLDSLVEWWLNEGDADELVAFMVGEYLVGIEGMQTLGELAEGTYAGSQSDSLSEEDRRTLVGRLTERRSRREQERREKTIIQQATPLPGMRKRGPNNQPDIGHTLGKCVLTQRLAVGSTCTVFTALHKTLNIMVAVKVFNDVIQNEDTKRLSRNEAQLIAQLDNPHIVRVLDFEEDEPPYIIEEYVDGLSVLDLIHRSGSINQTESKEIILQVAKGLRYAHGKGVIHRDVKPANLLINRDGTVKVADLGIAAMADAMAADEYKAKGFVCGTPAYIAPETAVNPADSDERSDIYSLGATLYHMLTGSYPFEAQNVELMLLKHLKEPVPSVSRLCPAVSHALSDCVERMMHKSPNERQQSMDEVIGDLESLENAPASLQMQPITTVFRRVLGNWFGN